MTKTLLTAFILSVMTLTSFAGTGAAHINIDIQVEDNSGGDIQLRLPLAMIKIFGQDLDASLAEVNFDGTEVDVRQMWKDLRKAGPNNFIDIKGEGEDINISTTRDRLFVTVTAEGENMKLSMPLAFGDAFFAHEGALNLDDIINDLKKFRGQDVITIEGDTINGRVWID